MTVSLLHGRFPDGNGDGIPHTHRETSKIDSGNGFGRGGLMETDEAEFAALVAVILRRFLAQNGHHRFSDDEGHAIGRRLWQLVGERRLPRPLADHERGEPGSMTDAECAPLVRAAMGAENGMLLEEGVRQLVKACFYPEFKTCRDSFREVGADGNCRRQELARVLRRVSGTHCVDCPHWVALRPEQHERYVARYWKAGEADLATHRDVYLPEDFRRLRLWLHAAARRPLD